MYAFGFIDKLCLCWRTLDKGTLMLCTKEIKGYCETRKQIVPLSFCRNACQHKKGTRQLPSKRTMAKNVSVAAVKHAVSGFKNRSQEEQDKLKLICAACENYIAEDSPRCSKCGCHLNIKQRWATANCPIDKWNLNEVAFMCCVAQIGDLMCAEPYIRYYKSLFPEKKIVVYNNFTELFRFHPDVELSKWCEGQKYPKYNGETKWYSVTTHGHITEWMPEFNKQPLPADFDRIPRLYLDEAYCENYIHSVDWDFSQPYVCVNPEAGNKMREWSLESWTEIIERLHCVGLKVVQIGLHTNMSISNVDLNLVGKTVDLQQAAIVIKKSLFFMGMDSGCSHIAAGVKKQCVIIFGSGREDHLKHEGYTHAVTGNHPCDLCSKDRLKKSCTNNGLCMENITTQEVWKQVELLFDNLGNIENKIGLK